MGAVARRTSRSRRRSGVLPDTLRQGNTTFVDLRATLDDLDPLLRGLEARDADWPNSSASCGRCWRATPTFRDLARSSPSPGPSTTRPTRRRTCRSCSGSATPAFRSAIGRDASGQPVIDFLRPYSPELVGWFRDFGRRPPTTTPTATTRASCRSSASSSSPTGRPGGTLVPVPGVQRFDGYSSGQRAAARAPPASPPPTARTRSRTRRLRLRSDARAPRPMRRAARHVAAAGARRRRARAGARPGGGERRRRRTACGRSSTTRASSSRART